VIPFIPPKIINIGPIAAYEVKALFGGLVPDIIVLSHPTLAKI
jgi:hypothetical protein